MAEDETKDLTDEEAYRIAMQMLVNGTPEGGRKIPRRHQRFAMSILLVVFLLLAVFLSFCGGPGR